ncbi:T9SS type A sorting domain-containing protein [candidate division KSB1 bacterium]|nr:T9SS type A sorting domain-containing protein [candidate division KSB1 bacterium]
MRIVHLLTGWVKTNMSRYVAIIIGILIIAHGFNEAKSQTSPSSPTALPVFGGRIRAIEAVAVSWDTTRVFISTESANSVFYANVYHGGSAPLFGAFNCVPDFDEDDDFGTGVRDLAADSASQRLFLIHNMDAYSCTIHAGTRQLVANGAGAVRTKNGRLFLLKDNSGDLYLHFGIIAADGTYTETGSILLLASFPQGPINFMVNPANDSVYVFVPGAPPYIIKTQGRFDALTPGTTVTRLPTSGMGSHFYDSFGIGPDGRIFAATWTNSGRSIMAYSDNEGAVWDTLDIGLNGTVQNAITCSWGSSPYFVYMGSRYSTDSGLSGWTSLGFSSFETHPNDGPVKIDPNNPAVVYFTTDQGIGASVNNGADIFEIDDGVEAVQVNGFSMDTSKTMAWTASKSGVRFVRDYGAASEAWSTFWPMGDGSPYYCTEMDLHDTTGGTAYAGNVRLYKTSDGGANWDRLFDSTTDPSFGFDIFTTLTAIALHPHNPNVVFIGFNSYSPGVDGGIFYTEDGGSTWNRVSAPGNIEVKDLLIVTRGDTAFVYVACDFDDGSYGVKVIEYHPTHGITFHNNMWSATTGTRITNFGAFGLAFDSDTTVYACGVNGTTREPRVYRQETDTSWTLISYAALPAEGAAKSLTFDPSDDLYLAIANEIYYIDSTGTGAWTKYYEYPVGTDINFIYYDELLVGTGTGLYAHPAEPMTAVHEHQKIKSSDEYSVIQAYPNPFNPTTTIEYRLKSGGRVSLDVYNLLGQHVISLIRNYRPAGVHQVIFDARGLPSGIYFYHFQTNGYHEVRKLILMR